MSITHYNCILKNNTNRAVRVLVRSWYGEGDYWLSTQESTHTVFKESFKSLIAFDQETAKPIGWYFMDVKRETIFKVLMKYDKSQQKWVDPYEHGQAPGAPGVENFSISLGGIVAYEGEAID